MNTLNQLETCALKQIYLQKEIDKLELECLIIRDTKGIKNRISRIEFIQKKLGRLEVKIANTSNLSTPYDK